MAMQNGITTLECSLAISYKTKCRNVRVLYDPANTLLDIYPDELTTYVHHKNLYMNVYRSFTHNCQNLEATKMYFNRSTGKLYVHTMEYYSVIKEMSFQAMKRHGGNLNAYC